MRNDQTMLGKLTRRQFPGALAGLALGTPFAAGTLGANFLRGAEPSADSDALTFPVLGDIHFDRMEHHDLDWLRRDHPGDVRQVENYSKLTREIVPRLFEELQQVAASQGRPVPFVIQVGDLVEGLCGDLDRARVQCNEAIDLVRRDAPKVPFLFTKGNHDITGPGATEAFDRVLLPFLREQTGADLPSASYTIERAGALFVFVDAYDKQCLDWLERTLARRSARHLFVVIHPPVVPFGARSLWHLYANPNQQAQRQRLLNVLGEHRAIVVCGHLHKFGVVVRTTDRGPFLQLAVSSIIPRADVAATQPRVGVAAYGPDLVDLEPSFSPETLAARREALRADAPSIRSYEYADAPGYAVIEVQGGSIVAIVALGLGRRTWKKFDLTGLLA
jgi:hypothetical protein